LKIFSVLIFLFTAFMPCVAQADTGFLWLVNKQNSLPESYAPSSLVDCKSVKLRQETADAFNIMQEAMTEEGMSALHLQSGYRNYGYQQAILRQREKELMAKGHSKPEAAMLALKSVQPPGASEHQLGLALDVSINGKLEAAFGETPEGIWLAENCHKFGFIMRYPAHKTHITGIVYEPWHLRYVGHPHASIMKELDLTLEEYQNYLRQVGIYMFWGETEYWLVMYKTTPSEDGDVSSFNISKNEFVTVYKKSAN